MDNQQSVNADAQPQTNYNPPNNMNAQPSAPEQMNNRYNQNAGNGYQDNNVPPANYGRQSKPKSAGKGLKIALFVILGISGLLVIGIFAVMIFGVDSPTDIEPILEGDPVVEDEVKEEWDNGEYSINNIGADSEEAGYVGVWLLHGMKMNINDSTYSRDLQMKKPKDML